MKKVLILAFALMLSSSLCLMAQNVERVQIKTPALPNDPTLVDLLHYTNDLRDKKTEIESIYKNNGKKATKEFLKVESPEIYNNILRSERQVKKFAIIGGSMCLAGITGAVISSTVGKPAENQAAFIGLGVSVATAIVGGGLAAVGFISGVDAVRDGVIIYKRAVDDEINNVKSLQGAAKTLSLGPTNSGFGLKLTF
jgi:hypothetical protein